MYVAGTFSGWALINNPMTLVDNNKWKSQPISISTGVQELKFANTTDWTGDDWGNAIGLSGVAKVATGGYPNVKFTILQSKLYTIWFNDKTLEYSITDTANEIDTTTVSKVRIYPNPASNLLNVSAESGILKLELFDAIGSCRIIRDVDATLTTIDVSSLGNGVYIIQITNSANKVYTQKLIISK
jgi:hypothetical protein